MDRNGRPRRRVEASSVEPSTITEITRRYYACAVALAKAMGVPMSETFLQAHRESISCCFIEAGRAGVRLPPAVQLPPLATIPEVPVGEPSGDQAPEVATNGELATVASDEGQPPDPEATRLTQDQARELKRLAHTVFGYPAGDVQLRADLGFEVEESVTLRHLCKHVAPEQAQNLLARYTALRRHEANGHGA